jgi:hypothetical protein
MSKEELEKTVLIKISCDFLSFREIWMSFTVNVTGFQFRVSTGVPSDIFVIDI